MNIIFTYKQSAEGSEIIDTLVSHLQPKVELKNDTRIFFTADITLENAREQLLKFKRDNFPRGQLILPMSYVASLEMAKLLSLFPLENTVDDYIPKRMEIPGTTSSYKIELYPLTSEKRDRLTLTCSPDYRSYVSMTPEEELETAIQTLRFGRDFFTKPLTKIIGEPDSILLQSGETISIDTVTKITQAKTLSERVTILKESTRK